MNTNKEYNCVKLIESYLNGIGIVDYEIKTSHDDIGFLITILIPKSNNEKIGILKGKNGRNLKILKQITRVVGLLERVNPFILIKIVE
jgi:hypothetical protein